MKEKTYLLLHEMQNWPYMSYASISSFFGQKGLYLKDLICQDF